MIDERIPTNLSLTEKLDTMKVSLKSIDILLKEKNKFSMEINITKKKNDILLESINFKNINISPKILYWHAAKQGLIMGKNIIDFNTYSRNLGSFISILQKYTGDTPNYSDDRQDPKNISITFSGKPKKLIRIITDKNNDDGFQKHLIDFSNYNLSINLLKISKYEIARKLIAFVICPGLRVKLSSPAEMIKNASICLPGKFMLKNKQTEIETETKFNISFLSLFTTFFSICKTLKKVLNKKELLNISSILNYANQGLLDPELSIYFKYFEWITHNLTFYQEHFNTEKKIILKLANNIQFYKRMTCNSGSTFSSSIDYKNPFSENFKFLENISLHSFFNHAIKLNEKDSIVFNIASSFYFSDKINYAENIHNLNIPFAKLSENKQEDLKIQKLLLFQLLLLHEAFDLSELTSPLDFFAKVRLGFSFNMNVIRLINIQRETQNLSNTMKLIPISFLYNLRSNRTTFILILHSNISSRIFVSS